MNAEQAKFLVEHYAGVLEMEAKTTAKVIGAVPDNRRDYKPDDKSRSAWELATHLAVSDVWFLDSIIEGSFNFDPEVEKRLHSDPRLQEFLKKYRAKYGKDPDAIGGLAYDAARVLFQSLEQLATEDPQTFQGLSSSKANTPERQAATKKLRDLIAATRSFPGVSGTINLDENRNASKPAVVIEVKDGKKVYNTSIQP